MKINTKSALNLIILSVDYHPLPIYQKLKTGGQIFFCLYLDQMELLRLFLIPSTADHPLHASLTEELPTWLLKWGLQNKKGIWLYHSGFLTSNALVIY